MTNPDEIAFPVVIPSNELYPGLTKRELFAAMAMQGLCSQESKCYFDGAIAAYAVEYADALIAELNKEQK